ncbi:MAG: repeat protein [Hyphomicrobiales bacterium]|nr:repeat protein [Hyphomicrobiales bacterium]
MSQTSMSQHVTPLDAGSQIVAGGFFGSTPVFALADGRIAFCDGETRFVTAHENGAILMARCDGQRFVTGGDDGRIVATRADGSTELIADEKGRWIDALAVRADGAIAWAAGKQVRARDAKGEVKTYAAPSTVRGVSFMPKGYRLALAHYNGVSLWFPNMVAAPEAFTWAGSHLDVTVSPDARFLVSAMQENSLHGWRVSDHKDMRMTGYPSKTRSFSWSADGYWLATSGAEACIVWPFQTKDGPMGKGPRECGVRPSRVTQVAFHPRSLVVAIGYHDGWVMICRLTDAAEILVRSMPVAEEGVGKDLAITCLAWSADGGRLVYGAEDGSAGVLDLPAS